MVGPVGFEPTAYWSQTNRATRLRYGPTGGTCYQFCRGLASGKFAPLRGQRLAALLCALQVAVEIILQQLLEVQAVLTNEFVRLHRIREVIEQHAMPDAAADECE